MATTSTTPATLYAEAAGAVSARHLELAANTFQQFRGAVTPGGASSVSAKFADAALAARAAVEFQRRLVMFNLQLPEPERVAFRIGIHTDPAVAVELARKGDSGHVLVSRAVSDSVVLERGFTCNWLREDVFELMAADSALGGPATSTGDETLGADTPPQAAIPAAAVAAALPSRYEILGEIGRGGMGVVYKARDRETNEVIALKVLQAGLSADPALLERFKNELRLARKITHKNVCRIHEFNRAGDLAYISMEFVDGESLREMLKRTPKMPPAEGSALAQQVCAGLKEAHAQGVVHRDLKPENIMVDRAGVVKLMDFGIARSLDGATTHTRGIIGTPAYMAPEQAEGRPVDHRTDIYSLGLILYEMFTGVQAFRGQTMVEVVLKQIRDTPPRPSEIEPGLPAQLEAAIVRCLQKDPSQRFQNMDELDAALGGRATLTPLPPPPMQPPVNLTPLPMPPARQPSRRSRIWMFFAIFGLFFAVREVSKLRREEPAPRKDIPPVAATEEPNVPPPAPPKAPKKKAVEPDGKETAPDEEQSLKDAQQEIDKVKKEMPPIAQKGLGWLGQMIPQSKLDEMLKEADDALAAGNFDHARQTYIGVLVLSPQNPRAKEGLKKVAAAQREALEKKFPKKQP